MSLNRLRDLLKADKPFFGVIVTMPSPQAMQILARAGFDWLIIDMEHGPIDLATAHAMVLATAGTQAVPLARIAANVPWLAKPLLDCGVMGINVPMINTRADAEAAGSALRYPPEGSRMWGPFYAPLRWGMSMRDYMTSANEAVMSLLTIEHIDAVRNIDEIVQAKGADIAIIGPGDLATSMGLYGQIDHPDVQAAIAEAERKIRDSSIALGGAAFSPEQANRMVDYGYRMIALGFDWTVLNKGAASMLQGIARG